MVGGGAPDRHRQLAPALAKHWLGSLCCRRSAFPNGDYESLTKHGAGADLLNVKKPDADHPQNSLCPSGQLKANIPHIKLASPGLSVVDQERVAGVYQRSVARVHQQMVHLVSAISGHFSDCRQGQSNQKTEIKRAIKAAITAVLYFRGVYWGMGSALTMSPVKWINCALHGQLA
jgi:hypothetical protein